MITKKKWDVLMVEQILPPCTIRHFWSSAKRMFILVAGFKRLKDKSGGFPASNIAT